MKRFGWAGRKPVLKKLLVSYIILLVLLLASSIFVYHKTKRLLMTKEVTYNRMVLNYTSDIVDQNIQNIYDSCVTFIRDKNVRKWLGDIDFIGNQTALIKKLLEFTQKNNLVEHVILYNPSLDYVLYEEGSLSVEDKKYIYYEKWQKNWLLEQFEQAAIGYISKSEMGIKPFHDEEAYITIYFSSRYVADGNVLLLLLPEERMRDLFKSAYSGNRFMIVSESGEMIVRPEEVTNDDKLIAEILNSVEKSEDGQFEYGEYQVIHEKSHIFNWEYTALIRKADIFRDVNVIRNITLYILLGIFMLGALVIIISVRDNYLPLEEILNAVSGSREREGNEYDKIKHSISDLKENNQIYRESQILSKLIRDEAAESELKEFFKQTCVCSIFLTGSDIDRLEEVKEYLINRISSQELAVRMVHSNKNEVYMILNDRELSSIQIHDVLVQLLADNPLKLWAGVGTVEEVRNLKMSCDSAKKAMKEGKIGNTGLVYEVQHDQKCSHLRFPIDFESNMMSHIYAADKEKIRNLVAEVLQQNSQISWSSYEKMLLDFHECYSHLVHKLETPANEEGWKKLFARRLEPDELEKALLHLYEELVFDTPINKRAEFVGKYVKDYVQRNYMDPGITIEAVAGELNLVPTYVSTLFKKEANISFSQYLSDYRIQKAKELLEQTDMKVKDVAAETGFGTYNNFTRVFKKKLGITPNEYKNHGSLPFAGQRETSSSGSDFPEDSTW